MSNCYDFGWAFRKTRLTTGQEGDKQENNEEIHDSARSAFHPEQKYAKSDISNGCWDVDK